MLTERHSSPVELRYPESLAFTSKTDEKVESKPARENIERKAGSACGVDTGELAFCLCGDVSVFPFTCVVYYKRLRVVV